MKLMSPKAFYYTVGKKNFFQYILFGIFVLFFYLPLMNLCMLAFADKYEVPAIIPQKFGFRWWEFVLGQGSLLSSIATSFVLAAIVTAVSLLICIPAAYALARYNFKGKRVFLLSFLLSNAYPRMGLYISIGILFYRLNLMGTFVGVIIIHVLNSMMFMTWIPSGASGACTDSRRNLPGTPGPAPSGHFPDHASVSMPALPLPVCSPSWDPWRRPRERCWWASPR